MTICDNHTLIPFYCPYIPVNYLLSYNRFHHCHYTYLYKELFTVVKNVSTCSLSNNLFLVSLSYKINKKCNYWKSIFLNLWTAGNIQRWKKKELMYWDQDSLSALSIGVAWPSEHFLILFLCYVFVPHGISNWCNGLCPLEGRRQQNIEIEEGDLSQFTSISAGLYG